jgi:hypothetical protein
MGKFKFTTLILLTFISNAVLAQGTPPPPPLPIPLPGTPIDSNLLVLLVIGLAFGTFFLVKKLKKQN